MGRKWNITFGYATSSLLRTKPPASKWLVAPGPRRASHSSPMIGRRHIASIGAIETGCVHACWM